jgi:hypothetical protein
MRSLTYLTAFVICAALGAYAFYLRSYNRSLWRFDNFRVQGVYRQWVSADKPIGSDLSEFLSSRQDLELFTNKLIIDGTNVNGLFLKPNLRSAKGKLMVTNV